MNTDFLNNISEMKSLCEQRKGKYYRNYRRYNNTPFISLENIKNPSVVGYYQQDYSPEEDTTPTPELNVIRSCINALVSKIAQSKVRPFFNTINGSYEDMKAVKAAQHYFDCFFDQENVNQTVSNTFRDACIFDTGWVFVNEKEKKIERALPWQVFYRPADLTYGHITKIYYEQKEHPVESLPFDVKTTNKYVTYGMYYDVDAKKKAVIIPEANFYKEDDFDSEVIPFIPLFYDHPINGSTSTSIVDMLNSLQIEIDIIMSKIKDASQLNPAMTAFLPSDSSIKTSQLNNRIGNVVYYKPTPNMTTSPVTVMTPAFIDQQYFQLLDLLIEKAYEMVGISQLSAQSKKPTGLNSGVALTTMEDVESDRFETQLNQIIRCYVNIAKTMIEVMPKNEDIMKDQSIKWGDIVKMKNAMTIQFSGADQLSKDPSTKLAQLTQMAQVGVIPQTHIAKYLQIPDIDGGFNLAQNAFNAVQEVISNCIKNDVYDIPEFVPFSMLKEEILNTQLLLTANGIEKNQKDIEKLTVLYKTVINTENAWTAIAETETSVEMNETEEQQPAGPTDEEINTMRQEMAPMVQEMTDQAFGKAPNELSVTQEAMGDIQ